MLEVVHVTKRYRRVLANDDINLTIEDGRIGVLLGPNGAGKSTIIKCIMGFLKYQGQIQVNGLENKSIEAKKIMGYIPEIPSLYPNLTVDEHMEFIARAYKLKDYKAYKNFGLGIVVLKDGEVVAGASSYSRYDKGIEIEIDTREDHRRKGLAYACGAKLILECLEEGLYPSWDAQNKWSVALAEKLGYHFSHEYVAYEIMGY